MKKSLFAVLAAVSLVSATARPAHAGLVIGLATGEPGKGTLIGLGVGLAVPATMAVVVGGCEGDPECQGWKLFGLAIIGGASIVVGTLLDVDASLGEGEIAAYLQERYPAIESSEAVSALASLAKSKLSAQAAAAPGAESTIVRFSRDEIASVFESTSVPAEMVERVSADLQ